MISYRGTLYVTHGAFERQRCQRTSRRLPFKFLAQTEPHPAAKSFQGPILAPRSKFHTVTFETSSHGEGTEEGEQVGSLSR